MLKYMAALTIPVVATFSWILLPHWQPQLLSTPTTQTPILLPAQTPGSEIERAKIDASPPSVHRLAWHQSTLLDTAAAVQLQTRQGILQGRQVAWDRQQLILMLSNGQMRKVAWDSVLNLDSTSQAFQPDTAADLRQELQAEFGPTYRVDQSHNFLLVRPQNHRSQTIQTMQQFLGNVQTYCSARRIPLATPAFPLTAIILPNRSHLERYAASQGEKIPKHYVAYYSLFSNRIILDASSLNSSDHLRTVYHEAFHQVAFNSKLHYRSASPPRWVAEGMATAFEAPGLYDHRRSQGRSDRLHPVYHRKVQHYLNANTVAADLQLLITDDTAFDTDPEKAYCLAWGLCFYLMEFQPQHLAGYLQKARPRQAFGSYSPSERLQDFLALAPSGFAELAQRLNQFYSP